MNSSKSKHNGNIHKVNGYHQGWAIMAALPVVPGGRTAKELEHITGISQQAISCVERQALKKLRIRLQHSKIDLAIFNNHQHQLSENISR